MFTSENHSGPARCDAGASMDPGLGRAERLGMERRPTVLLPTDAPVVVLFPLPHRRATIRQR